VIGLSRSTLCARLFSTSKIVKQEEDENYINRLIERKKVYDEQEQIVKEDKKDPWDIYKDANKPRDKVRMRTSEGFSKERRSSKFKRTSENESEGEPDVKVTKEGTAATEQQNPVKKTWKEKLQEKRDKIQTKHGKLVDPADLDLHYKNKKVNEMKVYGKNACLGVFERRKEDIIKCLILEELMEDKRFRPLFKYMAEKKLTYRATEEVDLRAFSDSIHHEGIVMVTKRPEVLDVDQSIEMVLSKYSQYERSKREKSIQDIKSEKYALQHENEDEIQREELENEDAEETVGKEVNNAQSWDYQTIAMLENVQNPHNLGALVRVLAFFGVKIAFVANLDAYNAQKAS
jgi:tRNA G18 (ribose-2'-O)-methylase SpoU